MPNLLYTLVVVVGQYSTMVFPGYFSTQEKCEQAGTWFVNTLQDMGDRHFREFGIDIGIQVQPTFYCTKGSGI